MDMFAVFVAKYLIYVVALVFANFLYQRRSRKVFLLTAASLAVAYVLARIVGLFYSHAQPFVVNNTAPLIPHVTNNTFPSDHTLVAAVLATIVLLYNRNLGLLLFVCALAIGAARVYAGLHYPVDIAASVVLAVTTVWLVRLILKRV